MIFDAGVFIALDSQSHRQTILAVLERMIEEGIEPATTEAVLAQAWRDPPRQVALGRLVKATTVHRFGDPKTVGLLCAQSGTSDVVDASLAVLATQLERPVLTSDPHDLSLLGVEVRSI